MSNYKEGLTLSIVSYSRGTDLTTNMPLNPHWSFHLDNKQARTLLYQLSGSPGQYYYGGEEKQILLNSKSKDKIVRIGAVPEGRVGELDSLFDHVPIRNSIAANSLTEWGNYRGCRAWCLDAIEPLRKARFIDVGITTDIIKAALKPDWDTLQVNTSKFFYNPDKLRHLVASHQFTC